MEYVGLVGDAFHADEQKSNKRYGLSLQKDHGDIIFGSGAESTSIDPKCNTVCLMKSDKRTYRNMIAVSENYICYTVKGNLLRVIESVTGEKVLLRGHESPVLDVRFSPVDKTVLCSVDAGDSGSNHIQLWQLLTSKDTNAIEQTLLFSLSLQANNVKSHPLTSSLWAISFGNQLGLFHVNWDSKAKSYDSLKCHLSFRDEVIDFCLSPDGLYVAVITGGADAVATIGVFKLSGGGDVGQLQTGQYGLVPYSTITSVPGQTFSSMAFISPIDNNADAVLVTLSASNMREEPSSSTSHVHVWNLSAGQRSLHQSLSLTIPQTTQVEESDFPLLSLTIDTAEEKFVSISSRSSTIVACLGISAEGYSKRLYHCCFLNLKFSVSSVVNTTVHVREKEEAGRAPEAHVGITCFQNQQNGQHAVQQYHVPSRWLFQPPSPAATLPPVSVPVPEVDALGSSLLKGILFSKPSPPVVQDTEIPSLSETCSPRLEPTSNGSSDTVSNGISILSKEDGSLATLPVGSFPDFALISSDQASTTTEPAPSTTELPPQVDIGVKSKQILLNALKVHPAPSPPDVTSTSTKLANTSEANTKTNVSISKHSGVTSKPTATPIVVPSKEVRKEPQQQRQQEQEVQVPDQDEDEDDNWEKASISISRSQPSTPLASTSERKTATPPSSPATATVTAPVFEDKFNELLTVSYRMQEQIASLEEKIAAAEKVRNKKSNKASETAAGIPKALGDMKAEIISEVLQSVERLQVKHLSVLVEQKSQQAVANILASEKWRQQLSTQVSADLKQELAPAISQTIRSAVKDNVKGTIAESFRNSFETTIVPAYEAGTRELFSQLQHTYSAGVEVMKADNKRFGEKNTSDTAALRNEISSLKNTVASLETQISRLVSSGTLAEPNAKSVQLYETDYKQLYREGRIGESFEMALESKDIDSVLWVLHQQSENSVGISFLFEKSTELSIMCAVQQLAADLAVNEPEEGIRGRLECLKEMIMYLIDGHLPEGEDISVIVTSTLDNLKSAEAKHTLVGAARTDMKMLCSILLSNF